MEDHPQSTGRWVFEINNR